MYAEGLVYVTSRQHKTRELTSLALKRAACPGMIIEKLEIGILVCHSSHAWHSYGGDSLLAVQTGEILLYAVVAPYRIVETIYSHKIIGSTGKGLANQSHLSPHLIETARDSLYPTSEEMNIVATNLTHKTLLVTATIHMYIKFCVSRKTAYEIAQMACVFLYVNQKSKFHSRFNLYRLLWQKYE